MRAILLQSWKWSRFFPEMKTSEKGETLNNITSSDQHQAESRDISSNHVDLIDDIREMTTREKGLYEALPDSQPKVDQELVCLLLVGTLLCALTGWCWFCAETQQVVIPAFLWISALALLVMGGKQLIQEIFIQQSIDSNLNIIKKETLI